MTKGLKTYNNFVDRQMASLGLSMDDFDAVTRAAFPRDREEREAAAAAEQQQEIEEAIAECKKGVGGTVAERGDPTDLEGDDEEEEGDDEYDMNDGFMVEDDDDDYEGDGERVSPPSQT